MINIDYNIGSFANNRDNYQGLKAFAKNENTSNDKSILKESTPKGSTTSKDKLSIGTIEISDEEKKLVEQLKTIDQKVRAHEQAHLAAGGNLVRGGASFQYQTGPDGKQYAVGGEVQIDASPVPDDPEKTIQKMQQVRRAALAPSDPSAQDRKVAAEASQVETKAAMEKVSQKNIETKGQSKINKSNLSKYNSSNIENSMQMNKLA